MTTKALWTAALMSVGVISIHEQGGAELPQAAALYTGPVL